MANQTRFFLYVRKSTDEKNKQVTSLESQEKTLRSFAKKEGVFIYEMVKESKTAKQPGRSEFNKMLTRIEQGEADGLLCWDIDRLYRNPVDEGRVRWLLQNKVIASIRTPTRQFFPEDAGLLMGVEGGRATDYIIRLARNVKRGVNEKLCRGEWPGATKPLGYIYDSRLRNIVPHRKRAKIVQAIFAEYAEGRLGLLGASQRLAECGILSRTGRPWSKWSVWQFLTNRIYIGVMEWKGETFEGKYIPLIERELFDRVQAVLKIKSKPRKVRDGHNFPFCGIFRCPCGSMVADHAACSLTEFSTWPLLSQFKACQPPPFRREVMVKPDGFLRIHERDAEGTFEHSFFLEVDRSTETQQVLALRCGAYMDYYRSGGFAVRNGQPRSAYTEFPFRVLVVCKKCAHGYGTMRFEKKLRKAHHLALFLNRGEWPTYDPKHSVSGHICNEKLCVNPGHLLLETAIGNMRQKVVAQRQARGDTHGSVTKPECVGRGAKNGRAKLSEIDVAIIRKTAKKYLGVRGIFAILGRRFRIGEDIVSRIAIRDLWSEFDENAIPEATALEIDSAEFGRAKGPLSPSAKLSNQDVSRIRALYRRFPHLYGLNKLISSIWPIESTHLNRLKANLTWPDVVATDSDLKTLDLLIEQPRRQMLRSIEAMIRQNGWDRVSGRSEHISGADQLPEQIP